MGKHCPARNHTASEARHQTDIQLVTKSPAFKTMTGKHHRRRSNGFHFFQKRAHFLAQGLETIRQII